MWHIHHWYLGDLLWESICSLLHFYRGSSCGIPRIFALHWGPFSGLHGQISSGGMKEYLLRATDPLPMHISLYMQIIHDWWVCTIQLAGYPPKLRESAIVLGELEARIPEVGQVWITRTRASCSSESTVNSKWHGQRFINGKPSEPRNLLQARPQNGTGSIWDRILQETGRSVYHLWKCLKISLAPVPGMQEAASTNIWMV